MAKDLVRTHDVDIDPAETAEWLESLEYVLKDKGPARVSYLLSILDENAQRLGIELPYTQTTPYINTIPSDKQLAYPGNRELERRIKSIIRWNAMAMVVKANKKPGAVGGHISTYASSATLLEVGFNHFFRGKDHECGGDVVYFQGHACPGVYSRAFVEGRIDEQHLENFRRELQDTPGLSSYPHPWLMPNFWEYPTVSMGLGPIMSIYRARFMEYLYDRGLAEDKGAKVWAFLGDGECDEPETLGAITLASREKLDNLVWVINCNLQRLDGPVRGNGKMIQELEGIFRGAGWNVIKVIWGEDWDDILKQDKTGQLVKRMGEVVDGQYQKYTVSDGAYIREHFFNKYPDVAKLVEHLSDDDLTKLRRGGHDPDKVYTAYKAATQTKDMPTVILAKTVKGYGLGEAGEGKNITHSQKKLNEDELREFRSRFGIPISDKDVAEAPFYVPAPDSPEGKYLQERRAAMGGPVPERRQRAKPLTMPTLDQYSDFLKGSGKREMSTTMGFVRLFTKLLRDKDIGKHIVPIVPDESRTFGMEALFRQVGIYAHAGQHYDPVDSDTMLYYKEAQDGQIFEEGITEAGAMSSFIAAGTSHTSHGVYMIPFFIYYSMFGFQRIGDLIWAAGDMRTRGFMLGGTAGRTTLNGEGLQHQDGHSILNAIAFPSVKAYDPAYVYETNVIIFEGLKRMYQDQEDWIYYITLENDNYIQPEMPKGVEEGIVKGIYPLKEVKTKKTKNHVQLFGSGAILNEVLGAQKILAEKYNVSSQVWSVTSYNELRRDAQDAERWNMLHADQTPRQSYIQKVLEGKEGPVIAASDYVRAVAEQLTPWIKNGMYVLGTDGYGRSETREALRRFFEVDSQCIVIATLYKLAQDGKIDSKVAAQAVKDLGVDPNKPNPMTV